MTSIEFPYPVGRERPVCVREGLALLALCEAAQQNSDTLNQCEINAFRLCCNDLLAERYRPSGLLIHE
jgi:hypothetical protein